MKIKASNRILIPFFAVFFVLLTVIYLLSSQGAGDTVVIKKDGIIKEKLNLTGISSPQEIELGGNTVLVEKDGFSMLYADCPDKLCVKQGKITKGKGAVICLPNKVIVEFYNSSDKADAVSGAR